MLSFHPTARGHPFLIPWVVITVLIFLALTPPLPVLADIAPPESPPGANPEPDSENTQVRMLSEVVTMDVLMEPTGKEMPVAKVTALFNMRNLGTLEERMAVRFPLDSLYRWDSMELYSEIQDLRAWVNDQEVRTWRSVGENGIPWANFDVSFPPGKDVQIKVTYSVDGHDFETVGGKFVKFVYILETGAGWKGTIGKAEIIVRLPYEATGENILFGETIPGGVVSDREVRWTFEDLEPDEWDNFTISLVKPSAWRKVLTERENVRRNSLDGESWGRLGKAVKEIIVFRRSFRTDPAGLSLLAESEAAYQKAVELLPKDALWHLGYADLLATVAEYGRYEFQGRDMRPEMLRAVQEMKLAYDLEPKNERILDFLFSLSLILPGSVEIQDDQYVFLALTATPTMAPSMTPIAPEWTNTPVPILARKPLPTTSTLSPVPSPMANTPTIVIRTEMPATEPVENAVPESSSGLPVCGSLVLFPFLILLMTPVLRARLR